MFDPCKLYVVMNFLVVASYEQIESDAENFIFKLTLKMSFIIHWSRFHMKWYYRIDPFPPRVCGAPSQEIMIFGRKLRLFMHERTWTTWEIWLAFPEGIFFFPVLYRVYTKQKSSSSSFCYFDDDQGLA